MPVRNIEREMEALASLRNGEPGAASVHIRKALRDKVNLVVAKAAAVAADMQLRELIPDLCVAFERLFVEPVKTDLKCWGKAAVAKALKDLGHEESALFMKGLRYIQPEPTWGGEEDAAANLRATCALALLQCTDLTREDKLWALMPLITEASPSLRKDGAIALESLEGREAALLLRIKARMGDRDSTVTGQVFESLLRVEGATAVPFIVEFLRDPVEEVREEAALALGASRLTEAVRALKDVLSKRHVLLEYEVVLRALSISRHEEAIEFLLDMVRSGRLREAIAAVDALKLFRESTEVRQKVAEAVGGRSETEIQVQFQRLF